MNLRGYHASAPAELVVQSIHPLGSNMKHIRFGCIVWLKCILNLDMVMISTAQPKYYTLAAFSAGFA